MPLDLKAKKELVDAIKVVADRCVSVVALDYRGLNVQELTAIRNRARTLDVTLKIVRNTLSKKAFEETHFAAINPVLSGPILLAFSEKEPGAAARVMEEFLKTYKDRMFVRGLCVSGDFVPPEGLAQVASLPTKDEALALLMSVMKAPVAQAVRTVNEINAKMVRTVAAVGKKKEQAAVSY